MEKSTEPQPCTQWFVFFKDQLLLKKGYTDKGEIKYSVPVSIEPPLTPEAGSNIHEVFPPNGKQVRAFALEQPVAETDEWVMIGLRASYDYISPDEYRSAGKAFQILYWDSHSRFCPVCGTPMEQQTPIMKKCPECGNEMYPPVSTAIIRADTERQRNIAGAYTQLPQHVPRVGSRLSRNGQNVGTMRRAGSYGRNGAKGEKHHLFRQPALALSQRINGRIHCRLCRRRNQPPR